MSIRYFFLAFALSLAVIARAADVGIVMPAEPDHLVPVNPYPGESHVRYTDQLRSHFKLDHLFFAQMVVRPSFSAEYAVRLYGDGNQIDTTHQCFLTHFAADKSIYHSMPENNDKKEQRKVAIAVTTVEISKPLATRIEQLWRRMLLRTRYPEEGGSGLDGTTFEFSIWYVYGRTWSPHERKGPLLLIELGESLIDYCKTAPAERPAAARKIENKAAQLEKYLNKHPSK